MRGIAILKEISHAVMNHLDLVMSKVQRKRAERMIQSLNLFVEGSESLREWWVDSEKRSRTVDPHSSRLTIDEEADKEFGLQGSSKVNTSNITNVNMEKESRETGSVGLYNIDASSPMLIYRSSTDPLEILSTSSETESIPTELPESSTFSEDRMTESNTNTTMNGSMRKGSPAPHNLRKHSASANSSGQRELKLASELESMLARAANLIREAVSLSGVSFFDPPIFGPTLLG
jgi:hypothetical protein